MTPERWKLVTAAFQEAMEANEEDRTVILDRHCGTDGSLRNEVERLLKYHLEDTDFLDSPISATAEAETSPSSADPMVGRMIGQFRIVRRLAIGGMGVVYEAEQESPRRAAAVKVLHPTHVTSSALRRFEYETHVLGQLQHPGIARIYEAGTFDIGGGAQPYFAMELIDGRPITEHVRQFGLAVTERIQLLIKLCHAVQFAHQRGVIHRDLKPGNVLIETPAHAGAESDTRTRGPLTTTTIVESVPQPKILDFGIARAIDPDVQATTMHTSAGELVGTISYMSPEQVSGQPDAVDALSDVYALGVIGYELLTGELPHELGGVSTPEAIRMIAEQPPRSLSAVRRSLRGDLETIIGKALEKDPTRRYQSAVELAADLQRYLANEPITARPPSTLYQFRKFAQRNRTLVGGVLATMIAMAAGTGLFAWQAHQAHVSADEAVHQQQQASAVSSFLSTIFERIDPHNAGKDVNVRELIDHAATDIPVQFSDQPLSEAAVRNEIGTIYYNLSLHDEAMRHFRRALAIRRDLLDATHEDTLKSINNVGLSSMHLGETQRAVELFQEAVRGRRQTLGDTHDDTLVSMNNLAMALAATGDVEPAESILRDVLSIQEQVLPVSDERTLTTQINLASFLHRRGESDVAEQMLRDAVSGLERKYGTDHTTSLLAIGTLARVLKDREVLDESQRLFERQVDGLTSHLGAQHSSTLTAVANLALVYEKQELHREAAAAYDRAADGFAAIDGPMSGQSVSLRYRAGHSHRRNNTPAPAAEAYIEVAAAYSSDHGDRDERTIRVLNYCRRMLRDADRREEAIPYAARIAVAESANKGPRHQDTIIARDQHGRLLLDLERFDDALPIYERLSPDAIQAFGEDDWRAGIALGHLGESLIGLGRVDEALAPLAQSLALLEEGLGPDDDRTMAVRRLLQAARRNGTSSGTE